MANYNKSFNFRNGVQVDDDNFIVNANGLVGIGTSIPREFLDVHGTAKITGLVTATNLAVTGVSTFYSDAKIGSGITMYASTGIVSATAFYGSAVGLTSIYAIAVDGWYVNAGNLSTTSKVGIGTTLPYYSLQIGEDPLIGNGFSVDYITGNVNTTGIITASNFVGNVNSSGVSTFSGGLQGNLTGNVTGNINSSGVSTFSGGFQGNVTGNINSSGVSTFSGGLQGNLTGNVTGNINSSGVSTFSGGLQGNLTGNVTGNINSSGVSTLSGGLQGNVTGNLTGNVTGNINSSGVSTFSGGLQGNLTGNLVGIASTARDLISDARVSIAHITSQTSSIGISTVSTRLYAESIGVGTNSPSSDIHIRRNSTSRLQVTSDTAEAIVAVGRSTSLTGSNGSLRFGNTSGLYPYSTQKTLDIINYDTGNISQYLHYGSPGIGTGNFNWLYGQSATIALMSLTYQGNLGIGITNPTSKLYVEGSSFITGITTVNNNLNVNGNIQFSGSLLGYVNDVNSTGVSTFNNIIINTSLDAFQGTATFGTVGIGTTNPTDKLTVRNGDISVGTNNSHGVILTSPNGTRYRLIVNNAGALSTVAL